LNSNANPKKVLLALKRAVEATFASNDWKELGLDTDCDDIIKEDYRLLRSLFWGDEDYGDRVLVVIEKILERNPNNATIIEEFVSLEKWLQDNEPRLYKELYEIGSSAIDDAEEIGKIHNNVELNHQILRIKRSIRENDPSQAIGSSKELLESVLKTILNDLDQPNSTGDIPALLKQVQKLLSIDPNNETTKKLDDKVRKTLSNLGQVVIGVAEIRNLVGTGHGRIESHEIDQNHALLIVNSVSTISTYLINLWQEQKKQTSKN
jgi:hypothetical protein